ncbi:repressor protein [Psychromonas sp. CNPT3]|uniref:arsenite efflux transporter metallochaperone ArsD n=1 Tax=Psychromonas sp. CNPT3 TaxID=314282 RepID=UPI00006E70CB|nr:arsenite efflux transporter metallochaperone ArsD [Psychromonas sp. CNPT3]AGH81480.1 repressor protein [Psychromonas sp. CNPT3]
MLSIQIFEPSMCCSSGICGADIDPLLLAFSADVKWLSTQNITLERFNLAQQALDFAQTSNVSSFLEKHGVEGLPVLLVNTEIVLKGRYPTRQELASWCALTCSSSEVISPVKSSCCGA